MGSADINIEHLRSWIGREDIAEDVVSTGLARKFQVTFDRSGGAPQIGEPAPPLAHFCLAPPMAPTSALGEDGHPSRGGFLPPVPLPRRMWAGSEIVFHDRLRVGDLVKRVSRVADVTAKAGRSGLLCFVTVEHLLDVGGRAVLAERQDIVYCGAASRTPTAAAPSPIPVESGEYTQRIDASSPLLFRYSALTFNGHRIHYDRRYAQEVEGYPGLVVHGPLQATLLINLATEIGGKAPSRFAFRSQSPLFDNDSLVLHASRDGSTLKLWTARENGSIGMMAEAFWG